MLRNNSLVMRWSRLILATGYSLLLLSPIATASLRIVLHGTDTVAGYSSLIVSSLTNPGTRLNFSVTKPNGSVLMLTGTADEEGKIRYNLDGYHTHLAGTYHVRPLSADGEETSFQVSPDVTSASRSELSLNKLSAAADGRDQIIITASALDQYGNPLNGRPLRLLSSRNADRITEQSLHTNTDGHQIFLVTATTPGISHYTVIETLSNTVFLERAKAVFYKGSSTVTSSRSLLTTDLFRDPVGGPAKSLELTAPETAEVNKKFNVTVKILDDQGQAAEDYRGTVFFTSDTDENAQLPLKETGYTFTGREEKPAEHTFSLSTAFSTEGTHVLRVVDSDNANLRAEASVKVADALVVKESTVSLSSPTPGSSFGADPVPVIGQTKPNVLYKVFDNDLEIGQGQSDTNGDFNYSAETLNEGSHTVIIRTYLDDKATGESDPVSFTIDATPPTLDNLNILPENKLKSGTTGTLSLTSEPNLRQAKIVIDHSEYQLVEDRTQPGTYTKSFTVPEKTGAYPLKVYLTDALGNATEPVIDKTLTVASAKPIPVISTFKLTTESKKISLSWEQPTDTTNLNGYHLYLGTTPLDLKPQTNVPAAATSATLENLTPETKYYVSLKAVSLDDEEGEQSPILSTTTTPDRLEITNFAVDKFQENRLYLKWELNRPADNLQNFRVKYGLKSQEYLETVTTKNNTLGWYLPDLIAGQTYYVQVEALATSGEVLASSAELEASTTDNLHHAAEPACAPQLIKNIKVVYHGQSATISWPAVSGPVSYLVYVGTKSGHYNLPTMTSHTNEIDLDLSNYRTWPQLYVSVQSKCRDGRASDLAAPVSVSTGPEALMVIGGSILVGALWKSRRRHH